MRSLEKQEKNTTYKNKKLPCNKKEEAKNSKKINKNSPAFIRKKISSYITLRIKKAGLNGKIERCKYVNIKNMVKNLEDQFDDEMTWENYGVYWDIDHIVPQCLFDFTDIEQIRTCWSEENVRPTVREENAKKADCIDLELIERYGLFHILEAAKNGVSNEITENTGRD